MRLIDAEELTELVHWDYGKPPFSRKKVLNMIDLARTIDAVPVVRCKECRHQVRYNGALVCSEPNGMMTFSPDGFCSYGQRRKDVE